MGTKGFRGALLSALVAALIVTSMAFVISTPPVNAPSTISASPGATLSPTSAWANTSTEFTVTVTNDYVADNIDNVLLIASGFTQPTDLEPTTWNLSEITDGVRFDAIGDNVITPGSSETFVFLWTTPNIAGDYMISVFVSKEEVIYTAYENLGGFIVTIEGIQVLTPRAPIYIEGNAGFTLENGVNGGGSGAENDPYIIENYIIDASTASGIDIRNTTAHFVVRNCVVENGPIYAYYGISLGSVVNGRIENNTCSNNYYGIDLGNYSSNNTLDNNTCKNNWYYGIYLYCSDNNTLTNNTCENNQYGIHLYNSSNNTIKNNACTNNSYKGIYLDNSSHDNLINNTCENNTYGIYLKDSDNNTLYHNTCKNSSRGIYLDYLCNYNILDNNTCENNYRDGIYLDYASNYNTLSNNTCENSSDHGIYLHSWCNYNILDNNTCENNRYGIYLDHSSNYNTLSNNTCENNTYGIHLYYSANYNILDNNTCENNTYGIRLFYSANYNILDNNTCENNTYGIYLKDSDNNTLTNNTCSNNLYNGIELYRSDNNTLDTNTCKNNDRGIGLGESDNNTLTNNTCENNDLGISLGYSDNNTLDNNIVENNRYGIYLRISYNNHIYHNNIINNTIQAYDDRTNYWDNGYPSGGNYWSDYTGADIYRGEDQNLSGSDRIGDTPYYIPGDNNLDRYPLMSPWSPITRGVEVSISPDYQENLPGGTLSYTVTITNTGNVADNYNLTASDNAGWCPMLDDNVLEIPAGENRQTTLGVIIPENAVPSTEDNITVTATSQADNTVSDNDSCIALVQVVWIGWIRQFGTSEFDFAYSVAVDTFGKVYVAGTTNGALPGQTSSGYRDAFVRKYDGSGNELWTRQFGSSTGDGASDVAVDGSGNVYIAGYTHGSLPGQTSSGGPDVYVRKYDADGNELWTRQFGTSTSDYLAGGIAVDTLGNVYVAGQTLGEFPEQSSSGSWDAFVRKYDASGNKLWTRQFGSSDFDSPWSVAVDTLGNVYVAGQTNGGLPGQIFLGYQDAFVRKYDASGNELWTRQFGSSAWDTAYGVAVDSWGNVYVTGGMPGGAFLRKYDGAGSELWTRQFGTWDYDYAYGVAVDTLGNVYVAGETLDALPGQSSSGGWDAYVRKYDGAGSELWTRQFGTSDHDYASGVVVDTLGNVYIAGYTHGSLPGQSSSGGVDAFLVKFVQPSPPPPPGIEWDASITATFSGGSDDAVFGVRPDATPGFDSAYDIPEPPPPVAPPYVRTFFYYPEQTPDELHRSCLAPEDLMEWPLGVEYAEGLENITLTWNVGNVPADYSIFLYRGENLVADMRTRDSYTFEASTGSYDFRIVVGRIVPFTLELTQGWNMISFPVLPENMSPDSIFGSYYVLYRWDAEDKRYVLHADSGSFIEPDPDVEAGVGYWAYVLEDENVALLGVPVYQLNLNLRQGWNLIGPPYGGSSIADLADNPDNSVIPWAFTWNAHEKSYSMTQLLEAGKGYWVYALQPPQPPYPAIVATSAKYGDNEIRINVLTGSIPALEWAYSVSMVEGSYSWIQGTAELDAPYVSLGTYAPGTYYVSLKHIDSGHIYFYDRPIATY